MPSKEGLLRLRGRAETAIQEGRNSIGIGAEWIVDILDENDALRKVVEAMRKLFPAYDEARIQMHAALGDALFTLDAQEDEDDLPCGRCGGSGGIPDFPCPYCKGTGNAQEGRPSAGYRCACCDKAIEYPDPRCEDEHMCRDCADGFVRDLKGQEDRGDED